jgi:hypothetical protein
MLDQDMAMEEDIGLTEEEAQEELKGKLDALSSVLSGWRSEAISSRQASGIETEWQEDEDYYEGIDDLNRNSQRPRNAKPTGVGSSDNSDTLTASTGSKIFPNITRPFVDASSDRTADMLLPVDDVAWVLNPTPIPEMGQIADGEIPPDILAQIQAEGGDEAVIEAKKQQLIEEVALVVKEARETAERAEKRIQDWHIECQYHAHARKMIKDCSRIGTGVLKGPIVTKKQVVAYKGGKLIVKEEIVPVTRRIDPINFYPHGACGEYVDNGSYAMDRDDITRKKLEELKGTPGYFDFQIDACLDEGPTETTDVATTERQNRKKKDNKDLFDIWYLYGQVQVEEYLRALQLRPDLDNESITEELDSIEGKKSVYIEATIVNDRVVKLIQNTLDTGEFPYDVMVWQARRGSPWGIGVGRQVRTAQDIFKAAWRNMMDNAGRASGPQVIWDEEYIEPAIGDTYQIKPWGQWVLKKSLSQGMRIDQVFAFIQAPMYQAEMRNIIEMAISLAQEATGLPLIMQGQTDGATPDTLGGMVLQNNNASTVMRGIARTFDDRVTERNVRRHYTYLLIYGEDNEKGDFKVDAKGSAGLVERDMQAPILMNLMTLFQNPVYGKDPKRASDEFLKAMRFDATQFDYNDEDWKEVVAKIMEPAPDSALEIANIRKEMNSETLASRENVEAYKSQAQAALKNAEQEFEVLMSTVNQDELAFKESEAYKRVTAQIKGKLAETMASIRAQMMMGDTEIAPTPVEPAQRAPAGQAYTQ